MKMLLQNQIILSDCLEILPQLPNDTFNAIITDPPYQYLKHKLDSPFDEEAFFRECHRILKKDSYLIFFGRGEAYFKWNYLCNKIGFKFKEEIIWDKKRLSNPVLPIGRCHENITILAKGKAKINKIYIDTIENKLLCGDGQTIINSMRQMLTEIKKMRSIEELSKFRGDGEFAKAISGRKTTKHSITVRQINQLDQSSGAGTFQQYTKGSLFPSIIRVPTEHYNYKHPTQKPLQLIEYLVQLFSKKNDLILDPFAGSGTLALAARNQNRQFFCIEKLPEYYDIILERLKDNSMLKPTSTFDTINDIQLPEPEIKQLSNFDLLK